MDVQNDDDDVVDRVHGIYIIHLFLVGVYYQCLRGPRGGEPGLFIALSLQLRKSTNSARKDLIGRDKP